RLFRGQLSVGDGDRNDEKAEQKDRFLHGNGISPSEGGYRVGAVVEDSIPSSARNLLWISPHDRTVADSRPQFLVMVSCKFRMPRATEVHAASSTASKSDGTGRSPMAISLRASCASFVKSALCFAYSSVSNFASSGFTLRDTARRYAQLRRSAGVAPPSLI